MHLELVELLLGGQRQGVGGDEAPDRRVLDAVDGGTRQHGVRGRGVDLGGAVLDELLGRGAHGAGGVDHVVDQHAATTGDVADDVLGLDTVLRALDPPLVDDGEVGVEFVGVLLGHLHASGVG